MTIERWMQWDRFRWVIVFDFEIIFFSSGKVVMSNKLCDRFRNCRRVASWRQCTNGDMYLEMPRSSEKLSSSKLDGLAFIDFYNRAIMPGVSSHPSISSL